MRVRSAQGDTVDALCFRYYGRTVGVTEAVLRANPGIAAHGPLLPLGTLVDLPDIAPMSVTKTINLWD